MDAKDKEAFESAMEKLYNQPPSELWKAACEYKDGEIKAYVNHLKDFDDEIGRLQAQNKKLREALEFYADFKNWRTVTVSKSNQRFCILTGADLEYFKEPNQDSYCGKRAREALKEVGEK